MTVRSERSAFRNRFDTRTPSSSAVTSFSVLVPPVIQDLSSGRAPGRYWYSHIHAEKHRDLTLLSFLNPPLNDGVVTLTVSTAGPAWTLTTWAPFIPPRRRLPWCRPPFHEMPCPEFSHEGLVGRADQEGASQDAQLGKASDDRKVVVECFPEPDTGVNQDEVLADAAETARSFASEENRSRLPPRRHSVGGPACFRVCLACA